jgi:hypothetical protein
MTSQQRMFTHKHLIPPLVIPGVFSANSKGIGSILFLKNGLKFFFAEKNYKNHLRRNNYEVCKAVVRCFPNILDVMVLENVNLS